jgi:CRISPR-associated protein Cas1
MGFEKRTRRPPRDPANALLSLGYTLLTDNLMAACEIAGLDPYDGFFHADKYGRPALALDLVEEFRPVIVDSVVLNLVNRGMLAAADFEPGPGGGVRLKQAALRTFFEQYSARLNTQRQHPGVGRKLTYQQWFEVQARTLRQVVEGALPAYRPMLVR